MRGFGTRLRQLRDKRALTQQELARAVGAHWMQISRYERDLQLPTADRIVTLARVLRVSADSLLVGERDREEPLAIENVRLFERFRALQGLGHEDQETAIRVIDALIAKQRVRQAVAS